MKTVSRVFKMTISFASGGKRLLKLYEPILEEVRGYCQGNNKCNTLVLRKLRKYETYNKLFFSNAGFLTRLCLDKAFQKNGP